MGYKGRGEVFSRSCVPRLRFLLTPNGYFSFPDRQDQESYPVTTPLVLLEVGKRHPFASV